MKITLDTPEVITKLVEASDSATERRVCELRILIDKSSEQITSFVVRSVAGKIDSGSFVDLESAPQYASVDISKLDMATITKAIIQLLAEAQANNEISKGAITTP